MMQFIVSPRACRDIENIWDYTFEAWGLKQADAYLFQLQNTFKVLTQSPKIGTSCDYISSGLQKYNSGSHVIFYRLVSVGIDIVRVLHKNMDFESHF